MIREQLQRDRTDDGLQVVGGLGDVDDVVGAIVMYDEPTEQVSDYAPYRLTVNGVAQPGGS